MVGSSHQPGSLRRVVRRIAVGALLTIVAALLPIATAPAHADNTTGQKITRAEVIARAQDWLYRSPALTYSHAQDTYGPGDSSTQTYRRDCSGLIDMAWHLGSGSPSTGGLDDSTYSTLLDSTPDENTDLRAGDILDDAADGHAILFEAWESDHTTFSYYSFGETPMVHGTVSIHGNSSGNIVGWPASHYKAYRYKNIIDDVSGTESAAISGGSCATTGWLTISIPSATDIEISENTCLSHGVSYPDGTAMPWVEVWTTVSWKPTSGTSPIGGDLNNLNPHVQMQLNNVTKHEATCEFANNMTDADGSGSRSCSYILYNPASGDWTADGWIDFDVNGDGKYHLGPHYLSGSPAYTV